MFKPTASQLTIDLLRRSICAVKVAAVLEDNRGIFAWGWNHVGLGLGTHAEAHAIRRGNRRRIQGATIWIASTRKRKPIMSRPCEECQALLRVYKVGKVFWRDADGRWRNG